MTDKKDFTEEHTKLFLQKLEEVDKIKKEGISKENLNKIINTVLLPFEKQCRVSEDVTTTSKVALLILTLCYSDFHDFDMLQESLEILVKRRGQLQQVVNDIISKAMEFCGISDQNAILLNLDFENSPVDAFMTQGATWLSGAQTLSLLKKLLDLTEGKIYVERERTVAVYCVAKLFEAVEGDVGEACKLMQDVQIETFTHLSGEEKTIFIANQVRLLMKVKDYNKALVVSNKASKKILNKKKNVLIKIKFCRMMVEYWSLIRNWLKVAMFYDELYQTYLSIHNAVEKGTISMTSPAAKMEVEEGEEEEGEGKKKNNEILPNRGEKAEQKNNEKGNDDEEDVYPLTKEQAEGMRGEVAECLEQLVLFAAMAPYGCEQHALLGKTLKERAIEDSEEWKEFAQLFFDNEIISWSRNIAKKFRPILSKKSQLFGTESFEEGVIFKNDGDVITPNIWRDLRSRVTEHNLNVIARSYTRITMARLQSILEASSLDEAEKAVRDQVTSPYLDEHIYAKIDRPAGIVRFAKPKSVNELLDTWSAQLNDLVNLVDETSHLIQREYTK